jgi:hypothetical protein
MIKSGFERDGLQAVRKVAQKLQGAFAPEGFNQSLSILLKPKFVTKILSLQESSRTFCQRLKKLRKNSDSRRLWEGHDFKSCR